MKTTRMITIALAAASSLLTIFPATILAADAARVVGDLQVDGIHFTEDGSVVRKLSDFSSPWTIYNLDLYFLGGNVGIGTMTPAQKLSVAGTIESTAGGFKFPDGTTLTTAGLYVLKTGDAMTGTLNISSGNLTLPATSATGGIIYSGGSPLIHRFGSYNFFAGINAGNLTMTGIGYNTAIGSNALSLNTTGNNNSASGASSLYSNTTGYQNTASGMSALRNNTTGYQNTASGLSALYTNTTGAQNTASGVRALASNTEGNWNTALGYNAGSNQTVGSNNIYIGHNVLGVAGESNVTRIGNGQTQTFISGAVTAGSFVGNGSGLTGITASQTAAVAKSGDTMTGQLNLPASGVKIGNSHGAITENWWEFGKNDGVTGTGIDFHGGTTLTDFAARIYRLAGDNAAIQITNAGTGPMEFRTGASLNPNMVITGTGKVGIGTATPSSLLSVGPSMIGTALSSAIVTNAESLGTAAGNVLNLANFGFISANQTSLGIKARRNTNGTDWQTSAIGLSFDVDNTSPVNNAQIWLTAAGKVGIGTYAPSEQLEITGNLALPATTATTGIIRSGGETFIHNFGGLNFFAGNSAGNLNMTGSSNVGIGNYSLQANTTGSNNSTSGYSGLYANTTGSNNTASGARALFANTTGSSNTASGSGALYANITGHQNTATGWWSLFVNQGNENTANGVLTLYNNVTGSYNTASGISSLYYNTTGNSNTASGKSSLYYNTTGSDNTASGISSLYYNTTGNSNTAIGIGALSSNTTGNNNIAIGAGAASTLTTGDGNIYIGTETNGVSNESNVISIGGRIILGRETSTGYGRTRIHGIYNAGFDANTGKPVYVDNWGRLGTASITISSLRFKEDIQDMGDATDNLMKLRPVVFHYKPEYDNGTRLLQYGLIAEEVAEVYPGLVQYDEAGKPNSVYYNFVNAMLLNEVQKQHGTIEEQKERIRGLEEKLVSQDNRLTRLEGLMNAK